MPMTRQQIFNTAYHGLAAQGFQQSRSGDSCRYRAPDGKRCALGYLLSDQLYKEKYDSENYSAIMLVNDIRSGIFVAKNGVFLDNLQGAHDSNVMPESMKAALEFFAECNGLTIPTLPVTADAPVQEEVKEYEHA